MNPLKAIRWKTLLVLGILGSAAGLLGVPQILNRALSEAIRQELLTTSSTEKISLSLLSGHLVVEKLVIDDPAGGPKPLFSADRLEADISVTDLLRRKVLLETIVLDRPRFLLSQDAEGKLNIEKQEEEKARQEGVDPVEVSEKVKDIYGTMENARDWVQRIRKILAYREARKEVQEESGVDEILTRETPLPELGPRFIIKDIRISEVDVALEGPNDPPSIRSAGMHGLELNADPVAHGKPMGLDLQGLFGADSPATFLLRARVRPEGQDLRTVLDRVELANLDVKLLDSILKDTLPFHLTSGRIALKIDDGWIKNTEDMKVNVAVLVQDLAIKPRPGYDSLAGFSSSDLCAAVSDAGTFEIMATLTGSPLSPKVSVDDSMQLLMKVGAKAFAKLALSKLESKYGASVLAGLTGKTGLALPGILSGAEGGGITGPGGLGNLLQQGGLTIPGADGKASPLSALDGLINTKGSDGAPMNAVSEGLANILGGKKTAPGEKPAAGDALKKLGDLMGGAKKKDTDPKKPPPPSPLNDLLKKLQEKKKKKT